MIFFAICLLYHVVSYTCHSFICVFQLYFFTYFFVFVYLSGFMFCVLFIYFILPSYKINNSLIFIKSAVYVRPNIPNIERHTPKKEAAYEYSYHGIPWWLATKK